MAKSRRPTVAKTAAPKAAAPTTTSRRTRSRRAAAVKTVSPADLKKQVGAIGELQDSVQTTCAQLSVTLTKKMDELETLETAISAQTESLKELHDIEVDANTRDQLEEQLAQLDVDIAEKRAEIQRDWERELEEHTYSIQQRRAQDAKELEAAKEDALRVEKLRAEDTKRDLDQRIEEVSLREQKLGELEAKVAGIENEIATAVEAAEAELTTSLTAQHSTILRSKEYELKSAQKLAEVELAASRREVDRLHAQVETLNQALAAERENSKAIATSALESASGRKALEAAQETASKMASSAPGGRR